MGKKEMAEIEAMMAELDSVGQYNPPETRVPVPPPGKAIDEKGRIPRRNGTVIRDKHGRYGVVNWSGREWIVVYLDHPGWDQLRVVEDKNDHQVVLKGTLSIKIVNGRVDAATLQTNDDEEALGRKVDKPLK